MAQCSCSTRRVPSYCHGMRHSGCLSQTNSRPWCTIADAENIKAGRRSMDGANLYLQNREVPRDLRQSMMEIQSRVPTCNQFAYAYDFDSSIHLSLKTTVSLTYVSAKKLSSTDGLKAAVRGTSEHTMCSQQPTDIRESDASKGCNRSSTCA